MAVGTDQINILHVDDDEQFGSLTATSLEREDDSLSVRTISTPERVVSILDDESTAVDCIVSDYEMPGMDGLELYEAVADYDDSLPFILFTGQGSEAIASEAISTGVTDYLQKEIGTDQFTVLANRIRNAVEARTAHDTATKQQHVIDLVGNVTRVLTASDSVASVDDAVCEAIAETDRYSFAWVGTPDGESTRIDPLAHAGGAATYLDEVDIRFDDTPSGRGPAGRAVREGTPQVSQNIQQDPFFEPWRDLAVEHGLQSVFVLPLSCEQVADRVLAVYADRPFAFDDIEQNALSDLGETIEAALDAAATRKRLAHRERALDEFDMLAEELSSCETPGAVFDRLIEAADSLLDLEAVVINTERDGVLDVVAASDAIDLADTRSIPVGEGLAGTTYADGESFLVADIRDHEVAKPKPESPYRAAISVPLGNHGVVQVVSETVNEFDQIDRELLEILASHGAGALDRLRTRDRQAELDRTRKLVDALSSANPESLFVAAEDGTVLDAVTDWRVGTETLSSTDLAGTSLTEILTVPQASRLRDAISRALTEGESVTTDLDLSAEFGSWYSVTVAPIPGGYDDRPAVAVAIRDVTDRRQQQQELEDQRRLLEDLFKIIPIHLFVKDEEGRHEWVSHAEAETPEEWIGKRDSQISDGEATALEHRAEADDERVLENGAEIVNKEEYDEQTGEWRRTSKVPRYDDSGEITGLIGYSIDITDEKRQTQALRDLQQYTQRLIETPTAEATGEEAAEAAVNIIGADLAGLFQPNDDGDQLVPTGTRYTIDGREPPTYDRNDTGNPATTVIWDAFENGTIQEIDDVTNLNGLAEETPTRSALVFPLEDHGVFVATATDQDAFSGTDKLLFELLGQSVVAALDRVVREQNHQRRGEQLRALNDHTRELVVQSESEGVAATAVRAAHEVLNYEICGVHLYDSASELLRPVAVEGVEHLGIDGPEPLGEGSIAWEVFQSGEPFRSSDLRGEDSLHNPETPVRSELILPLGEFGVLIAGSTTVGAYDDLDMTLAHVLAANVTTVLTQVEQQRELRRSRDLLSRTEQIANTGGWTYDADAETVEWTDGTRAIHDVPDDYTPTVEEALDFYHPEDKPVITECVEQCLAEGTPFDEKLRIQTRTEETKWVRSRGEPIHNDGEVIGLRGTIHDVTRQHRQEEELEQQRDNLKLLNQVVRHDVRNKLAAVEGYAQLLSGESNDEAHIETIRRNASEAVELTESARDLAKVILKQTAEREPVSLRETLETELDPIRSTDDVVCEVDGEIVDVTIPANDMLGSVFRNLLQNAVQHNDEPVCRITVATDIHDETVTVTVADNGPGIPDEQRAEIFDEGKKGFDSGGTGIGLYLVKTLVDQFRGSVSVRDREPKGTVFSVQLPLADSP